MTRHFSIGRILFLGLIAIVLFGWLRWRGGGPPKGGNWPGGPRPA